VFAAREASGAILEPGPIPRISRELGTLLSTVGELPMAAWRFETLVASLVHLLQAGIAAHLCVAPYNSPTGTHECRPEQGAMGTSVAIRAPKPTCSFDLSPKD
jgi:hypothetical protein